MYILDRFLYYYSILFALIITLGAFFSGFALTNLLATLLFLPVTMTLMYHTAHDFVERRQVKRELPSSSPPPPPIQPFTFSYFFAQRHPLFLATLAMFVITLTISILRAGLDYLPQKDLVSPVPRTHLIRNVN